MSLIAVLGFRQRSKEWVKGAVFLAPKLSLRIEKEGSEIGERRREGGRQGRACNTESTINETDKRAGRYC